MVSAFLRGLLIGFAAGVAVGAVVGSARETGDRNDEPFEPIAPVPDGIGDTPSLSLDDLIGQSPEPAPSPEDPSQAIAALRQNLLVKYFYDEEKVEQAIAGEKERDPQASEQEWLRAAIIRWERDNR
jgi:hypothetical protein